MYYKNIISKLKEVNLAGRGGACFSTAIKWEMVKNANNHRRFVICNAAEGEPGVLKDKFIIDNYAERVINGMEIAMGYLDAEKGFFYLNPRYYSLYAGRLNRIIAKKDINIKVINKPKTAGYIGGEETAAINNIEGLKAEPRLKPPFPTTNGLWDCPTLVNNVETFYDVSLIMSGKYKNTRFYTVSGDCIWDGVYEFPEDMTIFEILKKTNNFPDFDFFVQVGGDASGVVLNSNQIDVPANGAASITIYSVIKHNPLRLMKKWVNFFQKESCGKCTPCREGSFRLREIIYSKKPDWKMFSDILNTMGETSLCGLGCVITVPFHTYVKNVLTDESIDIPLKDKSAICDCFNSYGR